MITNFRKEKVPFTQVANDVLGCPDLSLKAKGLYAYLFSKPDGWDFSSKRMQVDHKDGRDSILNALKELEDKGVLVRVKQGDGRMEYLLKHATQSRETRNRVDDPKSEKPKVGKAEGGKSRPISNIDNTSNIDKESNTIAVEKSESTYASSETVQLARQVRDMIEAFGEINPACQKMYGHKNQRAACEDLIKNYTFEKTMFVITTTLPITNTKEFFPTITTPGQLFEKWKALEAAVLKYREKTFSKQKETII